MRVVSKRPLTQETIKEREDLAAKFMKVAPPESSDETIDEFGLGRLSAADAEKGMLVSEMEKFLSENVFDGVVSSVYSFNNQQQLAKIMTY